MTYSSNPLFQAIHDGDFSRVRQLVTEGHDVDACDPDHNNGPNFPLLLAAWRGETRIVRYLIDAGVDLEASCDESSLLHTLEGGWILDTIKYWDPEQITFQNALTDPLIQVAYTTSDTRAWTAVTYAFAGRHSESARALLDAGAELDFELMSGNRLVGLVLDPAHPRGLEYEEIACLLIEHGVSLRELVNSGPRVDEGPLMITHHNDPAASGSFGDDYNSQDGNGDEDSDGDIDDEDWPDVPELLYKLLCHQAKVNSSLRRDLKEWQAIPRNLAEVTALMARVKASK